MAADVTMPDDVDEYDAWQAVTEATERAIEAAGDRLSDMDLGAVQVLRTLARKIDTDAALREAYLLWQLGQEVEQSKLKTLQMDNVSIPTYLKFCESLGLTPAGRDKLTGKKPEAKSGGGTLSSLRSAEGKTRAKRTA